MCQRSKRSSLYDTHCLGMMVVPFFFCELVVRINVERVYDHQVDAEARQYRHIHVEHRLLCKHASVSCLARYHLDMS